MLEKCSANWQSYLCRIMYDGIVYLWIFLWSYWPFFHTAPKIVLAVTEEIRVPIENLSLSIFYFVGHGRITEQVLSWLISFFLNYLTLIVPLGYWAWFVVSIWLRYGNFSSSFYFTTDWFHIGTWFCYWYVSNLFCEKWKGIPIGFT